VDQHHGGQNVDTKRRKIKMMEDRRGSRRIPFTIKVKYESSIPYSGACSFNLSEGGIAIKASRVYSPQSEIAIFLYLGDEIMRLEGVVRWVFPNLPGIISSAGVKFISRTDNIRSLYRKRMNLITADLP
jgi:Tfp pilus assembly protein PilZ